MVVEAESGVHVARVARVVVHGPVLPVAHVQRAHAHAAHASESTQSLVPGLTSALRVRVRVGIRARVRARHISVPQQMLCGHEDCVPRARRRCEQLRCLSI